MDPDSQDVALERTQPIGGPLGRRGGDPRVERRGLVGHRTREPGRERVGLALEEGRERLLREIPLVEEEERLPPREPPADGCVASGLTGRLAHASLGSEPGAASDLTTTAERRELRFHLVKVAGRVRADREAVRAQNIEREVARGRDAVDRQLLEGAHCAGERSSRSSSWTITFAMSES